MKKETLDSLPHGAIEELIRLMEYFKMITSEYTNLITRRITSDESVLCEYIENISNYAFVVRDFKYSSTSGKSDYTIYRRPESRHEMKGLAIVGDFEMIQKSFLKWIADCQEMNKIKHKFLYPDSDFYEKEFSDFFSNNDGDASQNPFDLERQEILYYFLAYAEKKIGDSGDIQNTEKADLIKEISKLKEALPKDTKKVFVHHLSQFANKTKQVSNKLFHEIFDVLKKEIIKKVLYEGAAQIPNAVSKIEHWIALLGN